VARFILFVFCIAALTAAGSVRVAMAIAAAGFAALATYVALSLLQMFIGSNK
jgi:hypothetical protein